MPFLVVSELTRHQWTTGNPPVFRSAVPLKIGKNVRIDTLTQPRPFRGHVGRDDETMLSAVTRDKLRLQSQVLRRFGILNVSEPQQRAEMRKERVTLTPQHLLSSNDRLSITACVVIKR
jgi:hypothetical protein